MRNQSSKALLTMQNGVPSDEVSDIDTQATPPRTLRKYPGLEPR